MDILKFEPLIKRARWGGRRLATELNKSIGDETDYAESWEIADHGDDQSIVKDGEFRGWSLTDLLAKHGDQILGDSANKSISRGTTQFPLLIKFLDANDRLSLQVHPNDQLAKQVDPNENGKTEAWVIVSAEPGSLLFSGLKAGVDQSAFRSALTNGKLDDVLHTINVQAGDCVFIPAGTVHAIGEGIVLAEIQQQSDITYRIHDWGRMGTDGKPREIHIEESLACSDFVAGPVDPVTPKILVDDQHSRREQLVHSDYFLIERVIANGPDAVEITTNGQFRIVMVLDGEMTLQGQGGAVEMRTGSTALIPAALKSVEAKPSGRCTWLESST